MGNRYRLIRKWGNSFVIILKPNDVEDLNLKVGSYVDIEDAMIRPPKKREKENPRRFFAL